MNKIVLENQRDIVIDKSATYEFSQDSSNSLVNVLVNENCFSLLFVALNNDNIDTKYNIKLSDNSKLDIIVLNTTSSVLNYDANITSNSELNMYIIDLSNESKITTIFNLNSSHSRVNVYTTSITKANSKNNISITANHNHSNTYSNCISRAVVYSKGDYANKTIGFIAKGMNKSSCHQDTKAIVLDKEASAQCDPILLIDEYDVEASHAAAVGQINTEDLYYLQSRGLTYDECVSLLVKAFVTGVIENIGNEEYRELIVNKLVDNLKI